MEGKGFDPIVEAIFGEDGFFPDTIMKTTLYATDKMPAQLNDVLDNMLPMMRNERKKRQVLKVVKMLQMNVFPHSRIPISISSMCSRLLKTYSMKSVIMSTSLWRI